MPSHAAQILLQQQQPTFVHSLLPGTVLSTSYFSQQPNGIGIIILPIFQIRLDDLFNVLQNG